MILSLINMSEWQAIAGAIVIVLTVVFKFLLDVLKDKRERDASSERLQVLRDIAQTNMRLVEGQMLQNGKLSEVAKVNVIHHEEMVRLLTTRCLAIQKEDNKNA